MQFFIDIFYDAYHKYEICPEFLYDRAFLQAQQGARKSQYLTIQRF